ncbi:hypothetical protein FRC08_004925 [Ceratobasidium sp. 394]|nr:hypothetical protein FRC08_004925 [Ceratobasidium sp. 394]
MLILQTCTFISSESHLGDRSSVPQEDACIGTSEAEIEGLVQAGEDTISSGGTLSEAGSLEEGEIMSNKSTRSLHSGSELCGAEIPPRETNVSQLRVPAAHSGTTSSPVRYQPYGRNRQLDDWRGMRYGDIDYALLPWHLVHLLDAGSKWYYSRTPPMSNCHNCRIGDVHFIPGEMEGYMY